MVGGNRGNGFSCQGDPATTMTLPDMLESVARQMRESVRCAEAQATNRKAGATAGPATATLAMALVTPRSNSTQVFVCKAGDLFADLANADPNGVRRCIGRSVRDFAGWLGWRIGHRLNNAPTNARGQRRWAREARSHLLAIVFAAQIALASTITSATRAWTSE